LRIKSPSLTPLNAHLMSNRFNVHKVRTAFYLVLKS
jgi:hypothetical protein